ncbi:MAG: hypothetical protein QM729_09800 [Solirubrobacterales bacterium]
MAEPTTGDRPVTADELTRLREENLRLRDLLIAKDAELGTLRGQVAALEAGTARVLGIMSRFRGHLPGPLQHLMNLVRRRA